MEGSSIHGCPIDILSLVKDASLEGKRGSKELEEVPEPLTLHVNAMEPRLKFWRETQKPSRTTPRGRSIGKLRQASASVIHVHRGANMMAHHLAGWTTSLFY